MIDEWSSCFMHVLEQLKSRNGKKCNTTRNNLTKIHPPSWVLTLANNVHKLRRHFVWNLCTNAKIFPFQMWHFVSPFLRSNFCWMHIFFLFTWKEKVMHAKLMKWSRQSSKKKDFHSTQFQLVTFDIMDSSTIHNIE